MPATAHSVTATNITLSTGPDSGSWFRQPSGEISTLELRQDRRAGGRRSAGPPRAAQGADGMARGRWGGSGGPRTHVCLTCAAAGLAPQHGTGCEAHGGPPGGRSPVRSFPTTATAGWGVQTPTSCLRMGSGAVGRQPKRVWVSPCARAARASASSGCTHPLGRAVP